MKTPVVLLLCFAISRSFAGTYGPQNFDALAVGATSAGGGTVLGGSINITADAGVAVIQNRPGSTTDRAVRLTYLNTFTIMRGSFKIPVLDPGLVITGFDVSFKLMQRGPDQLADGTALSFGNLAAASNVNGSEDEDADTPDWIELYNGTAAAVNLAGWRLTNDAGDAALWTLPAVSLGPGRAAVDPGARR